MDFSFGAEGGAISMMGNPMMAAAQDGIVKVALLWRAIVSAHAPATRKRALTTDIKAIPTSTQPRPCNIKDTTHCSALVLIFAFPP